MEAAKGFEGRPERLIWRFARDLPVKVGCIFGEMSPPAAGCCSRKWSVWWSVMDGVGELVDSEIIIVKSLSARTIVIDKGCYRRRLLTPCFFRPPLDTSTCQRCHLHNITAIDGVMAGSSSSTRGHGLVRLTSSDSTNNNKSPTIGHVLERTDSDASHASEIVRLIDGVKTLSGGLSL